MSESVINSSDTQLPPAKAPLPVKAWRFLLSYATCLMQVANFFIMKIFYRYRGCLLLALFFATPAVAETVYMNQEEFIGQAFADKPAPKAEVLWLKEPLQNDIKAILGHSYHKLRIRYWQDQQQSAWILDEIGKERFITAGFVIQDKKIEQVRILVFRESRGWEIRQPFFTEQFESATLTKDRELDTHIDNITGATLSVRAIKKLARLALYLHEQVMANEKP